MLKVIEMFKEDGTVDELGIGSIRDTIADALYPGTSVLHSRARYLLFIPWLLAQAANDTTPTTGPARLRTLEARLIESLLAGGETDGVIGRQARAKLKRMPSAAYWAALRRYDLVETNVTIEGFFRAAAMKRREIRREPSADDRGVREVPLTSGLDADLPPAPEDLLTAASFALSAAEADYLKDAILSSADGSHTALVLLHSDASDVDYPWEHEDVDMLPASLAAVIEHARRFHHAIYGAPLLYNLMLAEKRESEALIDRYRSEIEYWYDGLVADDIWGGWSYSDFWDVLEGLNPRVRRSRAFVDAWLTGARATAGVADDESLRGLVAARESALKGSRARLVNQAALDVWTGGSGLVRLDYRWQVARTMTNDIFAGLGGAS
jgi:hypothetical protein